MRLFAPAKLNLALSVGAPRASDGLHPIASWFVAIDFGDEVELERLDDGEASSWRVEVAEDGPAPIVIDWPLESDLAVRAHEALQTRVGRELPVRGVVHKRVPAGTGLGGGSADAAATLSGLVELFQLDVSEADLVSLAGGLGSDVVFALHAAAAANRLTRVSPSVSAFVGGTGTEIAPQPAMSAKRFVLLLPPFGCPTGAVYRAFDELRPDAAIDAERVVRAMAESDLTGLFNDLTEPAERVQPGLGALMSKLRDAGLRPHLTGSGAAVFVVGDEVERVAAAAGCPAVVVSSLV